MLPLVEINEIVTYIYAWIVHYTQCLLPGVQHDTALSAVDTLPGSPGSDDMIYVDAAHQETLEVCYLKSSVGFCAQTGPHCL